nr:hypothetical protein [Candidatus Sigynarchaeota archaeon]
MNTTCSMYKWRVQKAGKALDGLPGKVSVTRGTWLPCGQLLWRIPLYDLTNIGSP